jgi:hypothetical protein
MVNVTWASMHRLSKASPKSQPLPPPAAVPCRLGQLGLYAAIRLMRAWLKTIDRLMYSRYASTLPEGTAFAEKSSKSLRNRTESKSAPTRPCSRECLTYPRKSSKRVEEVRMRGEPVRHRQVAKLGELSQRHLSDGGQAGGEAAHESAGRSVG